MNTVTEKATCCPELDTTLWENKTHVWKDKLFIRGSIPELFHFPLPVLYAREVKKLWEKAQDANAAPDLKDFLLLAYDPSPWKGVLLLSVTREVPGAKNVKLNGTFLSKVFDGPYHKVPEYIKEMNKLAEEQGKKIKEYYFYFAYCPKCAKKYGHNYIVAVSEV